MVLYAPVGMGAMDSYGQFVKIHWLVSLKDALMVVAIYFLISAIARNWQWSLNFNHFWLFLIALPIWQGIIEYQSVYITHRWAYNDLMPLIFGIGVAPLLQMLILPPLAILISNATIRR